MLAVVGLLAAVGSAVAVSFAGTAGTSPGNGSYVGGVVFPGPEPLVLWELPGSGGKLGTCIEANVNGPLTGPYSKSKSISDAVYAELIHLYGNSNSSDVELAELSALLSHKYDTVDTGEQWSYVVNGQGGLSVDHANAMLAKAKQLAGPYSVAVTWPATSNRAGPEYTGTVTIKSASGAPVPSASVTLSGTGVTFLHKTVTTTSAGTASFGFRIAAGTSTSVKITASVSSFTTLDVYTSSAEQAMTTAGSASTQSGSHTGTVVRTRAVSLVKIAAGDAAKKPVAGYKFKITDAKNAAVMTVTTAGSPPSANLGQLLVGATYHATEIEAPIDGSLYIPPNPVSTFTVPSGTATWTITVADPAKPKPALATQISSENALVGTRLSDRVVVTGNDGEDGTITAQLLGPVAPVDGACSRLTDEQYLAAKATTVTTAVTGATNQGNGTFTLVGPLVEQPGCYGWAEKLALKLSGVTVYSPPTTPHESAIVGTPASPSIAPHPVAFSGGGLAATGVPVRQLTGAGLGLVGIGAIMLGSALSVRRRTTSGT